MDKKRAKTIGEKEMIGLFASAFALFGALFCAVFIGKVFDFKRVITKSDQAKIKII